MLTVGLIYEQRFNGHDYTSVGYVAYLELKYRKCHCAPGNRNYSRVLPCLAQEANFYILYTYGFYICCMINLWWQIAMYEKEIKILILKSAYTDMHTYSMQIDTPSKTI